MSRQDLSSSAFPQLPETETAAAVVDLCGPWQFKAADEEGWLPAVVPGSVHADLIRAGLLEDPFYRDNEFKSQWVEGKDWGYRRHFRVEEGFLAHDKILLDCRGLDTVAEIYLNGAFLTRTCNMFIEYQFDVKPLLVAGENEIEVVFRSILAWNKEHVANTPRLTWDGAQGVDSEKGTSFFVRKSGADFGWDWGIRLLGCGIWRPLRLAAFDVARISELAVGQDLRDPARARLHLTILLERFTDKGLVLESKAILAGEVVAATETPAVGTEVHADLFVEDPRLWWPNGLGGQPLYTVTVALRDAGGTVHARSVRVGLRTVELCQERDERGLSFGLKVNGVPVFCKGANWIPAEAIRGLLTEAHYLRLLRSCVEANMNMIRLWGGGVYEADSFYNFCDEQGLMIWHDFMFAVGPHLAEEDHLENVRQEIASVVRRLRHHPAIVLWCGNNEQESSMPRWSGRFPSVTWDDFDRIFHETIPATASLLDPDRPYWPGSPYHPLDRKRTTPEFETSSGDAHVWEVWHEERPVSWYAEHLDFRFVSEYGLQSLPPMETIRSFTAPEDRYFASRVLDLHNKAGKKSRNNQDLGNARIAKYVAAMFRMPATFDDWVYLSQLAQGEAMKVASESYRRNYPRTTGALYWQVNDNWPTVSGSGIDYYGRWKATHYMARRFFSPVLVCGWVSEAGVAIWGVNDLPRETPARLEWTLARFDGGTVCRGELDVCLPATACALLTRLDLAEEMGEDPSRTLYRNTDYECRAEHYLAYRLVGEAGELSRNVSFFVPLKYAALVDPALQCEVNEDGRRLTVVLSVKRFAAFVELGLREGYALFSDNYFHLLPGETMEVRFVEAEVSKAEARGLLCVRSLVDASPNPCIATTIEGGRLAT